MIRSSILPFALLLLGACNPFAVDSQGEPGAICWSSDDCTLYSCDCDGNPDHAAECLPGVPQLCATQEEACAAVCLMDFNIQLDAGAP